MAKRCGEWVPGGCGSGRAPRPRLFFLCSEMNFGQIRFSETQRPKERARVVRPWPLRDHPLLLPVRLADVVAFKGIEATRFLSIIGARVVTNTPSKRWHGHSYHHCRHHQRYRQHQKDPPHTAPPPLSGDPQWIAASTSSNLFLNRGVVLG